jgi:hypothetical protein
LLNGYRKPSQGEAAVVKQLIEALNGKITFEAK